MGPTDDDLTREVVAAHLGLPLEEDPAIVEAIERRFAARGWKMPAVNRRQAQVPRGATVLANPHGTAPGLWIEHGDAVIALLPGPPREMKPMIDGEVRTPAGGARRRRAAAPAPAARVREGRVGGRGDRAADLFAMAEAISRRSRRRSSPASARWSCTWSRSRETPRRQRPRSIARWRQLAAALGPDLVSTDGTTLEAVVGDLLRARGWWVAFAESCTGGLATSRLTDIPGSSDYVERSVVAYSNRAKIELLDVPEALIAEHGAVSEPVALAMAAGIRKRAGVERRRRHHRHCRARRRQRAETGRHRVHCRGRRPATIARAHVPFPGGREMVKAHVGELGDRHAARAADLARIEAAERRCGVFVASTSAMRSAARSRA